MTHDLALFSIISIKIKIKGFLKQYIRWLRFCQFNFFCLRFLLQCQSEIQNLIRKIKHKTSIKECQIKDGLVQPVRYNYTPRTSLEVDTRVTIVHNEPTPVTHLTEKLQKMKYIDQKRAKKNSHFPLI